MAMIKCPECGSEISTRAINCIKCGIPMSEIFVCPECNNVMLRENNTACNKCGCPIDDIKPQPVINTATPAIDTPAPAINTPPSQDNNSILESLADEAVVIDEAKYLSISERVVKKTLAGWPVRGTGVCCEGGNPISDRQKVNAVKVAFDIPANDNIFIIISGNIMGGIDEKMKGIALSSHGIYFKDDYKKKGRYYYDEFINVEISKSFSGYLNLSSYGFNISSTNKVMDMLYALQNELRGYF